MGKIKHRDELIKRIKNIDDLNVLDEIKRLLDINFDNTVYQLNEDQRSEINEAREEIKRGEGISSEQLDNEMDEWLNE